MSSYGIIAKTNGRNKVLDFRDGLVLAYPDDYAMIHGKGGKNHASTSVIKIAICDYSSGTGDKSTTLFANITPDVCEQISRSASGMWVPPLWTTRCSFFRRFGQRTRSC